MSTEEGIPQDLLLIQEIIGDVSTVSTLAPPSKTDEDEGIDSSGSDCDSQNEIEAHLLEKADEEVSQITPQSSTTGDLAPDTETVDSDSTSDADSDSDYEDCEDRKNPMKVELLADDEEEYSGAFTDTGACHQTKNEIPEVNITVPDIDEVGAEETLEKVGEVMSIVDTVVIVKGLPAETNKRIAERALDSDTLLVFEDRKVMGYVYETFGPTTQPLYQVRYNKSYPLDPTKVWVSRQVFHVPQRSRFIFLKQIWSIRGSDASNAHDEEPGENEVEFSDDEQEAAYKKRRRMRGVSQAGSSRFDTPTPSQIRDQDLNEDDPYFSRGTDPYDEHALYDMDFTTSVTRPPPTPYDDPYSDAYGTEVTNSDLGQPSNSTDRQPFPNNRERRGRQRAEQPSTRGRGRGRGRAGRNQRRDDGGRQANFLLPIGGADHSPNSHYPSDGPYDHPSSRQLSPTSFAIARATGQIPADSAASGTPVSGTFWPQTHANPQAPYGFDPQGNQAQYVQPHINPRFASAYGINIGCMPGIQHQYAQFGHDPGSTYPAQSWTESWSAAYRTGEDPSHGPDPS